MPNVIDQTLKVKNRMSLRDEQFMAQAIEEAKKAQGQTFPNPIVGAIIVEDDTVVAKGYHQRAGGPHAEITALKNLGRKPNPGARIYVTLEPCSTQGRTGACTQALIESGISYVIYGAVDPNPEHNGRSVQIFKTAGTEVYTDVLAAECKALNEEYNDRMKNL